jgi:hypothetical protein
MSDRQSRNLEHPSAISIATIAKGIFQIGDRVVLIANPPNRVRQVCCSPDSSIIYDLPSMIFGEPRPRVALLLLMALVLLWVWAALALAEPVPQAAVTVSF